MYKKQTKNHKISYFTVINRPYLLQTLMNFNIVGGGMELIQRKIIKI
jgi:hypothetical protein